MRVALLCAATVSHPVGRALRIVPICCILCFLLLSCATTEPHTGDSDLIPLSKVISQVTVAVDQFRNTPEARYADLDSAQFEFQTINGKGGELHVNPYFFTFSFSGSREVTHTFTFTYGKPGKARLAATKAEDDMTKDLVEMIKDAAVSARGALSVSGLRLNQVDLTVLFVVKRNVTVGGQAQIQLVTLGGSVTASHSQTQSVKLTFKRKQ